MPHSVKPNLSFRLALAALSVALISATAVPNVFAQQSDTADKDDSDFQGRVVKTVKASGEKSTDEQKSASLPAMSGEGLGKGISIPTSEETAADAEEVEQKPEEQKPEEEASAPSTEFPLAKKIPLQKGKAESDGTVSHGETGVDWSKWVSNLADRWFQNLQNLEFRSTKVFRTARPALIRFTCYRNGTISNIGLKQTCGVPSYDQMQIEALKRCTPLPAFPEGSIRQSYTLLQGWECHPRVAGEKDFKPGSFGAGFPVEKVTAHARAAAARPIAKSAAKTAPVNVVKPVAKVPVKATAKTLVKGKTRA